jgi:hypothetical protein
MGTYGGHYTVRSESRCALRLGYVDLVVLLKCAVVSLYSVVQQRLKCNIGKACNCLIQFLLTMVLSIEERVFHVENVFREGNRYTDLTPPGFRLWGAAKSAVYRDRPLTLNELKTAVTAYVRSIS